MKVQAWMAVAAALAATVVFPAVARADDGAAEVEAPNGDASIEVETPVAMADACNAYTSKRRCRRKGKKQGCGWNASRSPKCATKPRLPRVFFAGNSFTKGKSSVVHEFKKLLDSSPKNRALKSKTKGGYTLRKHVSTGTVGLANNYLSTDQDVLVLQEQSQHLQFSSSFWGANTQPAVETFREKLPSQVKIFLYETWGYNYGDKGFFGSSDTYHKMQTRITTGYAGLASRVDGVEVCPSGQVWRKVYDYLVSRDGNANRMYKGKGDNKHAVPLSHYAVACTFYACIFNESPVGLKYAPKGMAAELKQKIQEFAAQVVLGP